MSLILPIRVLAAIVPLFLFDTLIRPPTNPSRVLFGMAMLFSALYNFGYVMMLSLPAEAAWGAEISVSFTMLFMTLFSFFLGLASISLTGKTRTLLNTILCAMPTFTIPLVVFPTSKMFNFFSVVYHLGYGWKAVYDLRFYIPWLWIVIAVPVLYTLKNLKELHYRVDGEKKWNIILLFSGICVSFFLTQFIDSFLSVMFNILPQGGIPFIVGTVIMAVPFITPGASEEEE